MRVEQSLMLLQWLCSSTVLSREPAKSGILGVRFTPHYTWKLTVEMLQESSHLSPSHYHHDKVFFLTLVHPWKDDRWEEEELLDQSMPE